MEKISDDHPLLLGNLLEKAQASNESYLRSSVQVVDGYGSRQPKPRPFKQDQAVKSFGSWVYSCAMLNAQAFARVPLRLYVRKRSTGTKLTKVFETRRPRRKNWMYLTGQLGDRPSNHVLNKIAQFGDDFEEVTDTHPALRLLNTVNAWMDGFQLSVLRLLYLQITGNTYMTYTVGAQGVPIELLLMPSQWTKVIPSRTEFVGGYEYGRKPDVTTFAPDEVIHWKRPSLENQYYGMACTEAAWRAIGISESKSIMDLAVFDNMGRPDWLIILKNGGIESLNRLEETVNAKLRGKKKSGNFLAVSGDVDAKSLNFPPMDIGTSDRVLEEIANCFGVPISKLLANDPNRAGAETGDSGWMRDTILPYCRMDEEVLNARYLPLFDVGDDAVLAYDNPVPENEQQEVQKITSYVNGNVMVPNEGRALLGLPPTEWGDQPMAVINKPVNPLAGLIGVGLPNTGGASGQPAPAGGQPAAGGPKELLNGAQMTAAVGIVAQVVAGTLPRSSGIQMLITLVGLSPTDAEKVMGEAGTGKPTTPNPNPAEAPAANPTADAGAKSRAYRKRVEVAAPLPQGETIAKALIAEFNTQHSEVNAALEKIDLKKFQASNKDVGSVISDFVDDWTARLKGAVQPLLEMVFKDRGERLLTILQAPADIFQVFNRNVPKAAENLALKLAQSTNATTTMELNAALEQLRTEIGDGLVEGDTRLELRTRVQTVFDRATKSRAETIARTEASRATHDAELMSAKDSGVVQKKVWLLSEDACPICDGIVAANPGGVALDKTFAEFGGEYGSIDGPPAHPNCLLGETPVTAPGSLVGIRASYEGPVIRIEFSDGSYITGTPNHMLLTPNGFASLASLRKGDDVIDARGIELLASGDPNNAWRPTRIDEIVASLSESGGVSRLRVPVSAEYLHGDAAFVNSDIDVVAANGFLERHGQAAILNRTRYPNFSITNSELPNLARGGNLASVLIALRDATDGGVGLRRQAETFALRGLAHSDALGIGLASDWNSEFFKSPNDNRSGDTHSIGDALSRNSGGISAGEFLHFHVDFSVTPPDAKLLGNGSSNPELLNPSVYARCADTKGIFDFIDSLPGLISLRKIVNIEVSRYSGYVFDLHTESTLYIANGVISSNCQCSLTYQVDETALSPGERLDQ